MKIRWARDRCTSGSTDRPGAGARRPTVRGENPLSTTGSVTPQPPGRTPDKARRRRCGVPAARTRLSRSQRSAREGGNEMEYRRILLDGAAVEVRREGEELVAGDGRRVAAAGAVHLPPVVPTKIVAVHLNHHSRVTEFGATLPPA